MLSRNRRAQFVALLVIAGGITAIAAAPAAQAVVANPVCDAYGQDANGNPTGNPLATGVALPPLTLPDLGSGTVETGTAFEAHAPGTSSTLPSTTKVEFPAGSGTFLDANILEVKNIKLVFKTTGAASIGTATLDGGNVVGASAIVNGSTLTYTLPGSQSGSTIPGGSEFFPGGGTLSSPALTIPVVAPNSPGKITTGLTDLTLAIKLHIVQLNADLGISLICKADATIGSVTVINPPPPPAGAPDAINDNATTTKGVPVIVDVLKNDKPNKDAGINEDSLATTTSPTKGTATVNADHTITYTPKAGKTGIDSFKYKICSEQQEVPAARPLVKPQGGTAPACDTATVSIVINDPSANTTTTTSTTVVVQGSTAAPATTVAPAASTLPRTGSTSGPFTLIGFTLLAAGAALLWSSRRRRTAES